MKLKNVLLTLGLALGVGAAIGAASIEKESAKEVGASTEETIIYIDARNTHWFTSWGNTNANVNIKTWGDGNPDKYHYDPSTGRGTATIHGVEYITFDRTNYSAQVGGLIYCPNDSSNQNRSSNFFFADASAGQNLLTLSGGSDSSGPTITWGTLNVSTICHVKKWGICNNNKNDKWVIESVPVENGDTYAVPSRINLTDYHFGGWFIDEDCQTAYTARAISGDLDIYAKYTSFSKDSYIYYVNADTNETNDMLHTWGGDQEYAVNNQYIKTIGQETHGVITFDGYTRNIYRIPFSSESGDTAFKFHAYKGDDGWGYQSNEQTLVSGYAYNWLEGYTLDNAAAGAAIDFLLEEEELRNSVEDWGDNSLDYSICGINPSDAAGLYEKYLDLSARALQYVNNSYVKTYNDAPNYAGASEDNVKLDAIMEEILTIALKDTKFKEDHPTLGTSPIIFDSENSGLIIAIAAFAAILATGGFFFLRRRKEN